MTMIVPLQSTASHERLELVPSIGYYMVVNGNLGYGVSVQGES